MIYIISDANSTYDLLTYDHKNSIDCQDFFKGNKIKINGPINYLVNKEIYLRKIQKCHVIKSTGPTLFSDRLRDAVYEIASNEVQFFDVTISYKDSEINGFSAINPIFRLDCVDLEKSEYKITNFDKNNPKYNFYYEVLQEKIPYGVNLTICNEHHVQIIVSQSVKDNCVAGGLRGLRFCRSLDMTPLDRSQCEKI